MTWTGADLVSGIDHYLISSNGVDYDGIAFSNGTWTYGHLSDGARTISVRAYDRAGNFVQASVNITIDTIAPSLLAHNPTGNGVAVSNSFNVTFSEKMDTGSVMATINGDTATGSWNGNVVTFTSISTWTYNTAYTVTVKGTDLAGNSMSFTWSFETSNAGTIKGVLKDKNGGPIANAAITLSNGMSTTSDGDGYFSFANVTAGSYTMIITVNGHQTTIDNVVTSAGATNNLGSLIISSSGGIADIALVLGVVAVIIIALIIGMVFLGRRKKP